MYKAENNFSKENFWNALIEQYPEGMKVFLDWLEEYKRQNRLDQLFNYGSPHYAKMGWHNPYFFDLPKAFQEGIFLEFVDYYGGCSYEIEDIFQIDWKQEITTCICIVEDQQGGKPFTSGIDIRTH